MTIVDSINKITESLGGDTSGVQTAVEAIDALGPVIGGGGSTGFGTVFVEVEIQSVFQEPTPVITNVTTNGLTSYEEVVSDGLNHLIEPVIATISSQTSLRKTRTIDLFSHEFLNDAPDDITESIHSISGQGLEISRTLNNGVWSDWVVTNY